MKNNKLFGFLTAFLILFSNSGLAVNIHHCQNGFEEVLFGFQEDSCCADEVMQVDKCCIPEVIHNGVSYEKEEDSCCKVEIIQQKADTQQLIVKIIQIHSDVCVFPSKIIFPVYEIDQVVLLNNDFISFYCEANAPPLYKLYSQYIFYA